MKILAVDTATKSCSVAIVTNRSVLAELTVSTGQTHSIHLMKTIQTVIDLSETDLSALDGFAVTKGPGSFTGLRIGISTIKGLAAATGKQMVGISTLEALAYQSALPDRLICSLVDARKDQVYFSRYRLTNGVLKQMIREQVASPFDFLIDIDEACVFAGDGALLYKDTITEKLGSLADFAPQGQHTLRASTVAFLSLERFKKGDTDDVNTFVPHYIRKSDAEIKSKIFPSGSSLLLF